MNNVNNEGNPIYFEVDTPNKSDNKGVYNIGDIVKFKTREGKEKTGQVVTITIVRGQQEYSVKCDGKVYEYHSIEVIGTGDKKIFKKHDRLIVDRKIAMLKENIQNTLREIEALKDKIKLDKSLIKSWKKEINLLKKEYKIKI